MDIVPGEAPDQTIRRWWNDDTTFLDTPIVWVPYYCHCWRVQRVHALQMAYVGATHVILAAYETPTRIVPHGVVCLASGPTVADALAPRPPPNSGGALPLMEWLTLETATPNQLADVYVNMASDNEWLQRTVQLTNDVALAPDSAAASVAAWGVHREAQLASAKMRHWFKLCLARMTTRLELQEEAYNLGVAVLGAWTEAYVHALCTNHARAMDAARRHSLPVYACDIPPRPLVCHCDSLPSPTFLLATGAVQAVSAMYRGVKAPPSHLIRRDKSVHPRQANHYMPRLPTALFVLLRPGAPHPDQLAKWLARFLYENCRWPGNGTDVSIVQQPGVWGAQDVVFASGAQMATFVHTWSSRYGFAHHIHTDVYDNEFALNTTAFCPHVSVPRASLIHATHRLSALLPDVFCHSRDGVSTTLLAIDHFMHPEWPHVAGGWALYTPSQLGEWVRHRTVCDVKRLHDSRLPISDELMHTINASLGAALYTRLQAIAAQRSVKLNLLHNATSDMIFTSKAYRHIEDYAAGNPSRLCHLFRTLMAGQSISETQAAIRTNTLSFNVSGTYKMRWKEFSLFKGGGNGVGLASLVTHGMGESNPAVVLEWLQRWMDEHTRNGSSTSVDNGAPLVRAPTPEEQARHTQERVDRIVNEGTRVLPHSRAYSYLAKARGLEGAPAHLFEKNEHVGAIASHRFYFGDGRPPVRLPVVTFCTEEHRAVQVIYLEHEQGAGKCRSVPNPKKTHGSLTVDANRCDAVPICTPLNAAPYAYVFLAEGPETALSVACAFPEMPVYASLGNQNMRNFHYQHSKHVVVCMDNDPAATREASRNICQRMLKCLRARFVHVTQVHPPRLLDGRDISDFNDIHQARPGTDGTDFIRAHIGAALGLTPPPVIDIMDE